MVLAVCTDRDFLRAALMLLGIPYHAALPYSTTEWNISSGEDSWVFTAFADFVHLWRMPTFFVIAGYFALLILRRRGTREWLTGRFKRLGIPFLFGVVLVVPAQWFIQLWTRTDGSGAAADLWVQGMTTQIPSISHLWFLLDLLVSAGPLGLLLPARDSVQLPRQAPHWSAS
jgi:glucan biosynthesis protein C